MQYPCIDILMIFFFCLSRVDLVYMVQTFWYPARPSNDTPGSLIENMTKVPPKTKNYLKYSPRYSLNHLTKCLKQITMTTKLVLYQSSKYLKNCIQIVYVW